MENPLQYKHDTPPSHFELTLGQPALLYAFNGEHYPGKQQVLIFQSLT